MRYQKDKVRVIQVSIDTISFEIAQPNRMEEILEEMERRGILKSKIVGGEKVWKYEGV